MTTSSDDRDDRSRRFLGETALARVQSARVLVVGAGALGNELVKNLALLGVREMTLVDFDVVSASNLNRCVYFRPEHVASQMPKVAAVAEGLAAHAPDVSLTTHATRIEDAPEAAWQADVVALCVDNQLARYHVNLRLLSMTAPPPVVNGAMGRELCEVRTLAPPTTACLVCSWTAEYHEQLFRTQARKSCDAFFEEQLEPFPSISVLSSLCGGLIAAEVVALLAADAAGPPPSVGCAVRYELRGHATSVGRVYRNPRCVEVMCRRAEG